MTPKQQAAMRQALEALNKLVVGSEYEEAVEAEQAMDALSAALAEPVQEPVARECRDPMCACRGGPCAECEGGKREKEIEDLRSSLYFYRRRCEALQSWQSKMRDPERTIVCDILANGKTLDAAFAGDRYTAPAQRKPLTDEEIKPLVQRAMKYYRYAPKSYGLTVSTGFEVLARAIEAAHGITGGDDE